MNRSTVTKIIQHRISRLLALVPVLALWLLLACAQSVGHAAPAENDGQVAARETALELAGAFTNDGYKIRDGHWTGQLQLHAAQIITVNLYAGNQYYFSLGSTDKAKKVNVTVYDETGHQVGDEQFFQDTIAGGSGGFARGERTLLRQHPTPGR